MGDSATCGLGDADATGAWRGWARILADAIDQDHDVSFCNVAVSGSTVASVRQRQLPVALAHRPHLASLIVGLNDTMRSTWNADALRAGLLDCADRLTEDGALLLTTRFHDHSRILRLPRLLARPMRSRIDALNDVYDEIYYLYGGVQVDLAAHPGINDRRFWSIDRLHPSELGHRTLAHEFATLLHDAGLTFEPPGLDFDGGLAGQLHQLRWLAAEGAPWLTRRLRDLAPTAARSWIRSLPDPSSD
ncbi:MAG: SGNH/GDSL hydrolase family protein [Actinomycetota bacterium]|nr:SGNH/GDSL hydrolase family protein [Actinomycetota bacterium]